MTVMFSIYDTGMWRHGALSFVLFFKTFPRSAELEKQHFVPR